MYKSYFGDGFYEKNILFSCNCYRVLAICDFRAEGFLLPVCALQSRCYFIVKHRRPSIVSFVKLNSSWSVHDLLHHDNMSV